MQIDLGFGYVSIRSHLLHVAEVFLLKEAKKHDDDKQGAAALVKLEQLCLFLQHRAVR